MRRNTKTEGVQLFQSHLQRSRLAGKKGRMPEIRNMHMFHIFQSQVKRPEVCSKENSNSTTLAVSLKEPRGPVFPYLSLFLQPTSEVKSVWNNLLGSCSDLGDSPIPPSHLPCFKQQVRPCRRMSLAVGGDKLNLPHDEGRNDLLRCVTDFLGSCIDNSQVDQWLWSQGWLDESEDYEVSVA